MYVYVGGGSLVCFNYPQSIIVYITVYILSASRCVSVLKEVEVRSVTRFRLAITLQSGGSFDKDGRLMRRPVVPPLVSHPPILPSPV